MEGTAGRNGGDTVEQTTGTLPGGLKQALQQSSLYVTDENK